MLQTINIKPNTHKIHKQLKLHYNKEQEQLNLQGNKDWLVLLQSRRWTGLAKLWLGDCDLNDGDLGVIAELNWQNLEELRLYDNKIRSGGIIKLIINSWPKLQLISFSRNFLGDEGCQVLMTLSQYFSHVRVLSLDSNGISSVGLQSMPTVSFRGLTQLSLDSNNIGHQGVKYLTKATLPQLNKLFLGFCEIGDEGIKSLIKGFWPQMQHVRLNGNSITSTGTLDLLSTNWNKAKIISVGVILPIHLLNFVGKILKDKINIDKQIKNTRMRRNINTVLGQYSRW